MQINYLIILCCFVYINKLLNKSLKKLLNKLVNKLLNKLFCFVVNCLEVFQVRIQCIMSGKSTTASNSKNKSKNKLKSKTTPKSGDDTDIC